MVPDLLSSNLCSLRGGEERLAFSVIWELTDKAQVGSACGTVDRNVSQEGLNLDSVSGPRQAHPYSTQGVIKNYKVTAHSGVAW
jgi:hypothetical protein